MKLLATFTLIPLLIAFACTDSRNQIIQEKSVRLNNLTIEITEQGIFLNSNKISLTSDMNSIKAILGNPSTEKIQSAIEIQKIKEKFGTTANNIYTYDDHGIRIYQQSDKKEIKAISIDFKRQDNSFSPSSPFSGILTLNGVVIDKNTSLAELRMIQGLEISATNFRVHNAKFNNYTLSFEFNSDQDKNGLVGFSIDMNNIPEKTNTKGWTQLEIEVFKTSFINSEKIKTLSIKYNFNVAEFANCYAEIITSTMTMIEVQSNTVEIQEKLTIMMEDCIVQTAK